MPKSSTAPFTTRAMAELLNTIVPIFVVIGVGMLAVQRGYLPDAFLGPANRLVYHLAIPAMIFRAVATGDLQRQFNLPVLVVCLATVGVGYLVAHGAGRMQHLDRSARATFTQTAFHGNLGYIGLAVVFFHLGDEALGRASILAGFIMILQNLLAVVALSASGEGAPGSRWRRVMGNPVIVAAMLGIGFSAAGLKLPGIADQSLAILARMALPLALLVIGATLSPHQIRRALKPALAASGIKLVVLPGLGLVAWRWLDLSPEAYLPALILLASPTATVAYVMGREMGGDADLAAAVISLSTLLSGVTFLGWLSLVG